MRLTPRTSSPAALLGVVAAVFLSACGSGDDCGGPFCIGPEQPQATTIKMSSGDGQNGAPGRQLLLPIEVMVTDDHDTPIQDVPVTFSVPDGNGSLSATEVRSDVNGKAQMEWTLGTAPGPQSAQATASDGGGTLLSGAPVTFSAQAVRPPAAQLVIRQAPSVAARNGVRLEQQPIVEVLDADDQPVPQVEVNAALASGGGTLTGTASAVSDESGRATFSDLALTGASGPRTIRFSVVDPALEVISPTIVVGAGAPATLAGVAPLSYNATVSSPVTPAPSVVVKDAAGNGVPGISVTFAPNRDGSVSPAVAITGESGVAQVTSWTLGSSASAAYTLTARVEGSTLTPVVFSATARAGAAGRLLIVTQPSSPAQNAVAFAQQPVVQVADRNGNPASQANVRVTATVSSGPTGELQNATATTDGSGRAVFSGLTLTGAVGRYAISFSADGLQGVTSNAIELGVGEPAKLALATPPSANGRSRIALTAQPVIQVQDVSGNPVPRSDISVTATVDAGTTGGASTIVTDANGRAAFTDLAINGPPGQRTLTFTSTNPVLQSVSATVTLPEVVRIEANPSTPTSAVVGTTLTGVPLGVLKDVSGQTVADAPVTLSPASGSVSVSPASVGSDANGVVTAGSWTLGTVAGTQTVVVTVSETVALTVPINATADVPASMQLISGDGQTAPANSQLPDPLVVRVLDQYGNGVPGASVQWRGCDGSGDYNPVTDDQGFSSATQPTGAQPGAGCARAYSPSVEGPQIAGSPVTFNYTVSGDMPPSQTRARSLDVVRPQMPPPRPPSLRGEKRLPSRLVR
jgi:adhesin/invasin